MYCKHCNEKIFEGQTICVNCGSPIDNVKQSDNVRISTPKTIKKQGDMNGHNKIAIALLCLFLGGFGAHNFIMGENKKGIIKVVSSIFGIGFILAIIDFLKIITNKYVYDSEAFF